MLKALYLPMKTWFNSLDDSFKEKYEKFPLFWRDLETWSCFKSVKKLYLAATEKTEAGESYDILELEKKILHSGQGDASNAQSDGADGEKKKKRRNRWGEAPPVTATESAAPSSAQESTSTGTAVSAGTEDPPTEGTKKPRRSRWSSAPAEPPAPVAAAPQPFQLTAEIMQQTLVLQLKLKEINDRLMTVVKDAAAAELNPNRSPSPPPKYDAHGKRMNTREVRMRESLTQQRTQVIEEMLKLNPLFQPPADFVRQKPYRKLYIPYKEHPTYNFIGLIIGPRGNTQKRMERETGCKISIRGKGSVKEGSKGRAAKQQPDEDDELHCFVQGETEENVEAAARMVQELLVPVDDEKNEHKQKQLRELALINGTLKEDEFCSVCGEKGHRHFECPQRTKTFQAAGVRCAICGDQSHPTRDCPLKEDAPTNEVALDTEYMSFMAELGDDGQGNAKGGNGTSKDAEEKEETAPGVTVTKKGKQTVIQMSTVITGMPTGTPGANPAMPWMQQQYQQAYPGAYVSPQGYAPWGYPPQQVGASADPNAYAGYWAQQGTAAQTPAAGQNPAQPVQGTDPNQYQQYANWYAQQQQTAAYGQQSTPDTDMK